MRIRLFDPAYHPLFDDLPWDVDLAEWDHPRLVDMPTGLHRHVVRFVDYDGQIYALKELPQRLAEREYRLLRTMNDLELPVVAAVALVDRRGDPDAVLITRYLHYAVPFRHLFTERSGDDVAEMVVESIATLLARLHTAGFFWGDCSLSNALFRRDELHLSGYALDTETGELHERLSDGQRLADVEIAVVNIAGGLADLAAAGVVPDSVDPFEVAPRVATVYAEIWQELRGESRYDPDDPHALDQRLDRLHRMGFGVNEAVITDDASSGLMTFRPLTIDNGYHRRELADLTGIDAREHQARRMLDEIRAFRSHEQSDGTSSGALAEVGHRWLTDVYDAVLVAIPPDVSGKLEQPQLFIEILDHEAAEGAAAHAGANRTEELVAAAQRYVSDVLATRPHERTTATWRSSGT